MNAFASLFQKITAFFLAVCALFTGLFSGGNQQPPEPAPEPAASDVILTVPAVTTATERFTVKIENRGEETISFGLDSFSIEKETSDGWALVPKGSGYAVIEILVLVEPGGSYDLRVELKLVYGRTLNKGSYRFNFDYFDDADGGRGSASAEFIVAS